MDHPLPPKPSGHPSPGALSLTTPESGEGKASIAPASADAAGPASQARSDAATGEAAPGEAATGEAATVPGAERDLLPDDVLEPFGGRLGRYAKAGKPLLWPVMLAALAPMIFAVLRHQHCAVKGWSGTEQFTRACYSDIGSQFLAAHLDQGLGNLFSGGAKSQAVVMGHPPVTDFVMSLLGSFVPGGMWLDQQRWFMGWWTFVASVLLLVMVLAVAKTRGVPAREASKVALSPVVATTVLVAADIIGTTFSTVAIWAWSRRRSVAAGVLLGLAIMSRTYPLLILLAIVLVGVKGGHMKQVVNTAAAALVTCGVIAGAVAIVNPQALVTPYRLWAKSNVGMGSPWQIPQLLGLNVNNTTVTIVTILGWVTAITMAILMVTMSKRLPSVAQVAAIAVGVALITGKTVPVQSSIWLVPLFALCAVPWRHLLAWGGAELAYFATIWMYYRGTTQSDRGLPPAWFAAFSVLRILVIAWVLIGIWSRAVTEEPETQSETGPAPANPAEVTTSPSASLVS